MAKDVGTLAILSENATLLSENCCSCKYFGTHVFILFIYICFIYLFLTQKNSEEKSKLIQLHTEPKLMHWTKLLAPLT